MLEILFNILQIQMKGFLGIYLKEKNIYFNYFYNKSKWWKCLFHYDATAMGQTY